MRRADVDRRTKLTPPLLVRRRVSPPKLPTSPDARLGETGLADVLAAHARLVMAFAQKAASDGL